MDTIDTLEFDQVLEQYDEADHSNHAKYRAALIAYIDAQLAKAREEGYRTGWDDGHVAGREKGDSRQHAEEWRERAEAAEAKIAARQAPDLSKLEEIGSKWMSQEGRDELDDWMQALLSSTGQAEPATSDESNKDTCPKCGKGWMLHEFAVPAPYCP